MHFYDFTIDKNEDGDIIIQQPGDEYLGIDTFTIVLSVEQIDFFVDKLQEFKQNLISETE